MIFVGFSILMAYLKFHSWTSILIVILVGSFCMQFSMITIHFWGNIFNGEWKDLEFNILYFIRPQFVTATVLISAGAPLGKFNIG